METEAKTRWRWFGSFSSSGVTKDPDTVGDPLLVGSSISDYLNALEAKAALVDEAVKALEEIANADWRIIEGSIGPLMDVGYGMAGRRLGVEAGSCTAGESRRKMYVAPFLHSLPTLP